MRVNSIHLDYRIYKEYNMRLGITKTLFWFPRILCIAFATFLIIFSFDVFNSTDSIWKIIMGLLMHNIPTMLLYALIFLSWRREWLGAVIFALMGIGYIVFFWGKFSLDVYFVIAGPLLLISVLYLINWIYRKDIRLRLDELKAMIPKEEPPEEKL